ncbi:MAG: cyclophane-containing peptide 2OG-Fe(II) oxygenase YhhC [Methylovirgula sp.]|uniref:cyclophane-containing peptide 2OG-Fe(II) oxygenase YhhC n=1 Tax=Methylovirgula sp. TaxID=1978224 RepID=UPI0030767D87
MVPHFTQASLRTEPFPHAPVPGILTPALADRVLAWLRDEAPWKLRVESFYQQHEICLEEAALPPSLSCLSSNEFISAAEDGLARLFGETHGLVLANASAHRLSGGQTIKIHNDFIGDEESHRLLIQVNAGWKLEHGGLLMLFAGSDPSDLRDVYIPVHGSGFAFEISECSHHAVSSTVAGERFTLVYTFRRGSSRGQK